MKNLFLVAVAFGICSGTTQSVNAQANVNLERLTAKSKPGSSLKFIDNIEINPLSEAAELPVNNEVVIVESPLVNREPTSGNIPAIEKCSNLQFKYALLMDIDVESVTNSMLYNFIDDWWGTRYQYGGMSKRGVDCSAFCGKLMNEVYGVNLNRTAREQFRQCEKIADEELKEGDLVFFNTRGGISHVGFYLGNNYFVHSSVHSGVTISSLTDNYYSKKFICGGRMSK
jgi:lipoprotein Spr